MAQETKPKPKATATKKPVEVTEPALSKRDRFLKNAEFRANKVIERLQLLGRIADNPQNYQYTEEDILIVFEGVREMTNDMETKFLSTLSVEDIAQKRKISLS